MSKRVVCEWCGHSKSIAKDVDKAYAKGRADAIDEYRDMLLKECIETPNECWNLECPFADDVCRIITVSEQLKEQK